MSKWVLSFEKTNVLLCWLCVLTLGFIGYWEYSHFMASSLLDHVERTLLLLITLLFYIEIFYHHTPDSKKTFSWIIFVISIFGVVTTVRHLWLQSNVEVVNDALANVPVASWQDFLIRVQDAFIGTGACCRLVTYVYQGISVTELTLAAFGVLLVAAFIQQYRISEDE